MSATEFSGLLINNAGFLKPYAITLTRDHEKAKDLFQETLVRALTNQQHYHTGTNIKAWLHTMMRNIFINNYRRNTRHRVVLAGSLPEFGEQVNRFSVQNAAVQNLGEKELWQQVYRLPKIFREPFLMHYSGHKYQDIARKIKEPLGTIKSRIHVARKMLRERINSHTQFGLN
jgi:RNA polymerase sigma-70 factor (ECF subfamily)